MTTEIDPSGISINDLADEFGEEETEEVEPEEEETEDESTDEPEEGETEEEEDAESETGEKFVIDGEEFDVPKELAPVAEKLKRYEESVRADYTRKTQEAAEVRKTAETLQQRVQQEAVFNQQNTDLLVEWKTLDAQLKEYEGVDWAALAEQDIGAYSKHKELRDALRQKQQHVAQEFNQRKAFIEERQSEEQRKQHEYTVEAVTRAVPDYFEKYDNKVEGVAESLASKYGLTIDKAQLKRLSSDPVVVLGLVELSKYYDLIAKRPEVSKRVESAPKPAKLSRPAPKTRHQEAEKRLKSGRGRIEDLAKFL